MSLCFHSRPARVLAVASLALQLTVQVGARAEAGRDRSTTATELVELRRQFEELRRSHQQEMQALRGEIERLGHADTATAGDDAERALLRTLADEAVDQAASDGQQEETTFVARGLGLQDLNPEISATGDFLAITSDDEEEPYRTDFFFRTLGIHLESYLDPCSKMKVAIGVAPGGAELGEAYATRFALLPRMNLTVGKFRQQFGVVNRWHKHGLDQIDFPLALRQIFGPGGLNQTGFSFEWNLPDLWGSNQGGIVQLTEGENPRVFGENSRHLPSLLLRYTSYRDLSKDTYVDVGLSGLIGWNDAWPVQAGETTVIERDSRSTRVVGGDLALRWEPTDNMRYASFEWRTEFYHLTKDLFSPSGAGPDRLVAWGGFSSVQRQLSRTLEIGVRLDYFRPDAKSYASAVAPLAVEQADAYRWQVGPYLTFWQSPFVKVRCEIDYADGRHTGPSELLVALQTIFAAGPHKHERY